MTRVSLHSAPNLVRKVRLSCHCEERSDVAIRFPIAIQTTINRCIEKQKAGGNPPAFAYPF